MKKVTCSQGIKQYVIRLDDTGFYGKVPWGTSPLSDATVFDSMKEARANLNRIRDRLHFYKAEIVDYT
jgi:hypothetical protein